MVLVANKWDLKNEHSVSEDRIDRAAKNMSVNYISRLPFIHHLTAFTASSSITFCILLISRLTLFITYFA